MSAHSGVDVLIVNSHQEAARHLQAQLERQGHRVWICAGMAEALPLLEVQRVDLLLAGCQELAASGPGLFHLLERRLQAPVIIPLPGQPGVSRPSPVLPLEPGRIQAIAAQAQHLLAEGDGEVLRVGDLVVDTARKRVTLRGQQVPLPPIQFRLLAYLAQNAGRVVAARELLRAVWGYEGDEAEARELVKVHVRQIRRRLGLDSQRADYVQSVRGFGYVVAAPDADAP